MALETECLLKPEGNCQQEEEQRVEKDFLHRYKMTRLESLKKSSHFGTVLKNRVINNDFYTIYRKKNFIKKASNEKKLYISFVMKKKIGNAVIRNKVKRKLKSAVQKVLKEKQGIDLNYTYVIFGKNNVYKDKFSSVLGEVNKTFRKIKKIENQL